MFFVITYEDGTAKYLDAEKYVDALDYAEAFGTESMGAYTVEEYASEDDYLNSL